MVSTAALLRLTRGALVLAFLTGLLPGGARLLKASEPQSESKAAGPAGPSSSGQSPSPAGRPAAMASPVVPDFERQVRPLLSDTCFPCHGPDAAARQAELRLDMRQGAFADRGGYAPIVPGDAEASEVWRRITSDDPDLRMPPPDAARQLTERQVATIGRWIRAGAAWSRPWALQPPRRPSVPDVAATAPVRNPIDRFVLAALQSRGLSPSPPADRTTRLRRVTLALTGLPPTPAEVEDFLADKSPDAYERLVDRLLASPRYGEHMARPWLDAARYADTDGYQNDRIRYMWAWRDWVIMALNQNKPFDQFTIEQLAGDMLPGGDLYQQVATGFCRNHRINSEGGSIPEEWAVEYVVDRVDTLGTLWLGLTLGCARCHDHKYDPVTQRDYYRLFAYFNNVPEWGLGPNNGNSPPFIELPAGWPLLDQRQKQAVTPAPYKLVTTQVSVVRPNPGGEGTVMVMQEMADPRPTYLLRRGQYNQPDKSEVLRPGLPDGLRLSDAPDPANRLELARWLVRADNPLTARVTVNRYWQHFFGQGLVPTSENFGAQGERPSHPELLDWLAGEFVRCGWDVKQLHRWIVTSATYRQASLASPRALESDPDNRWLARGPRFRLSAHAIRDVALSASGLLVEQLGGPSVKPYMPPGIWKSISNNKYVQDHGAALYRRSLYTYWRRTVPPPTLLNFNAAEREVCVVRKDRTTTPLQALTLMNNITFVEAARHLAERMMRDRGASIESRIELGFRLATARRPDPEERERLAATYASVWKRFAENPDAARRLLEVGESRRDESLPAAEHAAWTVVANVLLNLDESITLE